MGLSSLLSKDDELTSVIKAKITKKIDENAVIGQRRPTFGKVQNRKNESSTLQTTTSQTMIPIQNLVSGKFQPRKTFDVTELDELAESIKSKWGIATNTC